MNKVFRHYIPASTMRLLPNRWDLVALPLVIGFLLFFSITARETWAPIATLQSEVISLDPANLPEYAMRTTLRMLAAMAAALIFTLLYGTLAAKSRRAEKLLVPVLDILQSVPVLGYISFTVTFFLLLFPGRVLGAEFAAIFAIFTSQAWNMTFSFYQSLRMLPHDLVEVSTNLRLSGWQKFWKLDVPFAMPGMVWNMMMSMSGGWFFVVASEAITVGDKTITLPGVGSYLALAIAQKDLHAVGYVILVMIAVILLYDQFLFRPLVAWADKFRMETTASQGSAPQSWVLNLIQRTRVVQRILRPITRMVSRLGNRRFSFSRGPLKAMPTASAARSKVIDWVWGALIAALTAYALYHIVRYVGTEVTLGEVGHVVVLGLITLLRVVGLILIASLIWVPLGVMIGLRPSLAEKIQPLAQFLAAFPANLLFPVFVIVILHYQLNPDIWLSPLIVLGTQWYILFNVIAGASAFPNDYKEAAANFRIRGWLWWRKVMLPGIFPYYVTGAITASGGAWNASIVSEYVSWGQDNVVAHGLGAYIAQTTAAGDFPKITLGVVVMSIFVVAFNRAVWRPMYAMAENKLRLN
ncbi:ABC transporter permease subunit [Pseudomonas extremaustralis]|jgi:NitT/TauT family transport system permease protein|uniref:ABC transporter permease subunit n=1 Tax=Pseudomonas extremaustralis TaxID=359110 RepID=A0A5C5QHL0_9PSED|nr:ABC transporter permease subunit [Pseudomonas extremaustralis]EZI29014.1 sulfonate ABC transporter permease [Pseudomonas extremaustralis 14-3 substr. 14-3b]MDG2967157.1 ABC transporter permease subunit [Pseudomonas extremaustralis]TWS04843.1 ABC transporter permease subunit [Pseudomonas extremaustralis]UUJ39595.1 ABC transporter permease subunit [Pseudomonas extremaustralis]SDE53038.1 NitT/TauT family transport system permease protein [Pseudomonas extremaustralis]